MLMLFTVPLKAQNSSQKNLAINSQKVLSAEPNHLSDNANRKWFATRYSSISTSAGFYNGGIVTIFNAPIGLQLNRKLNNNWYAFAGISATPLLINFNQSFNSVNTNKLMQSNRLYSTNNFNIFPKAELGLMYINDQKTFSISGSISVEKSNYYFAPGNQFSTMRPNNFNTFGR